MRGVPLWSDLTSPGAAALAGEDPVVVLPLAAVEQHGPHLPLSTDVDIGSGLLAEACRHLPEGFPLRVLPAQVVGTSPEHGGFAGTLSLEPALLTRIIVAQGGSLAAHGVRRFVLFNSHGGNRHVMDGAALALRRRLGMLVVKASWFRFPRPAGIDLPAGEWRHGLHGGAVETAMMLHLRPDLVRVEAMRNAPSLGLELESRMRHLGPEGDASFAWMAGDLHPSGITGDPTLGVAAMGARLVEGHGRVLAGIIQETRAFPLNRLGADPGPPPVG